VQEICQRYGIPYNHGPLLQQFGTVVRKIVKLTFPDSWLRKSNGDKPAERVRVVA
jgi:hypothetical protein